MELLLNFYIKLTPLYLNIILGFLLGKFFKIQKKDISVILIYFITPVIVFNSVFSTNVLSQVVFLPIVSYITCLVVSVLFLVIGKFVLKDSRKNLLAFSVGNGNTGYFGIPLVLALFGDNFINTYIFANLGIIFFENTIGVFLIARGKYSVRESLTKLLKLPIIYALILALIVKIVTPGLGEIYTTAVLNYRGTFATLGVMLIGIALSDINKIEFDGKFIFLNFLAKFLVWPLLIAGFILIDNSVLHLFNSELHKILLIQSIVPLPGNAIAFASLLDIHPTKAALTVFLSTIFALIYIPIFIFLFF